MNNVLEVHIGNHPHKDGWWITFQDVSWSLLQKKIFFFERASVLHSFNTLGLCNIFIFFIWARPLGAISAL